MLQEHREVDLNIPRLELPFKKRRAVVKTNMAEGNCFSLFTSDLLIRDLKKKVSLGMSFSREAADKARKAMTVIQRCFHGSCRLSSASLDLIQPGKAFI